MRAPPSFFGYQIFAALVPPSSACNLEDMMTLPLHYRLVSSGDPLLLRSRLLFAVGLCMVTWPCLVYSKQNLMIISV
ncbi:hypothetical protein EDD22DRAFT_415213 [Suillus occidentalis]|nr:hypothetical protein EDD22DRAFT_415213 [Suillus occidentalis]